MPLHRDENGIWTASITELDTPQPEAVFAESLPRYLTSIERIFAAAKRAQEFEFLISLFRVRGAQGAGWDPYQTTIESIPLLLNAESEIKNDLAVRHLHLWIYGHIVEASEPYELLVNLLEVANGGFYAWGTNFPKKNGRSQSPGEKIRRIKELALSANIPDGVVPLQEVWDRDLRNAIFHSDYVLYGPEIRILNPHRSIPYD